MRTQEDINSWVEKFRSTEMTETDCMIFETFSNQDKLLIIEELLRNVVGVDGYIIDTIGSIARKV